MNKYVLLLMGSMILNALSMEKDEDEANKEIRNEELYKNFLLYRYASEFANSQHYNPNLYNKIIEEKFSGPINVASDQPKKETGDSRKDKKS